MNWALIHPRASMDMLGNIPLFISEDDPRSAREQINANYIYGGWRPMGGFVMQSNLLSWPAGGDGPDNRPRILIAEARLRDETIRFYDGSWLAIIQADGTFEVSRID